MDDVSARLRGGLAFIESRLFARPTLAEIAGSAGLSPWHFHRVFAALTGETPASYVWKRQLTEICRRLVETRDPIVDVALDGGFESQASLTRAFTRHVGVSPARYRRAGVVASAHRFGPLDLDAVIARQERRSTMKPRVAHRPAFSIVGMAGHFTPSTTSRIPELWTRFVQGPMHHVQHRHG